MTPTIQLSESFPRGFIPTKTPTEQASWLLCPVLLRDQYSDLTLCEPGLAENPRDIFQTPQGTLFLSPFHPD